MIKLQLNSKIVLRTPRLAYPSQIEDNWPAVKELIKDSSPDFYQVIKEMSYESLLNATEKTRFTVQKYFNRACYRATPFGAFAAISLMHTDEKESSVKVEAQPVLHSYDDWTQTDNFYHAAPQSLEQIKLFANSSYYRLQDEIRYVQRLDNDFTLAAIDHDPDIESILQSCSSPVSIEQLHDNLKHRLAKESIDDLVMSLLEIQLLLSSATPNIIGEDYFQRIAQPHKSLKNSYTIAERKSDGQINRQLFRNLPDLARILGSILPDNLSADLQRFREAFANRYEQTEVPIMLALDPEAGVGYGDKEHSIVAPELETVVGIPEGNAGDTNAAFRERLFRKLLEHKNEYSIQLEEFMHPDDKPGNFPNSLTATCTIIDDYLWMDMMGGSSAISMSGRFALAIPEIEQYCREIATAEQSANPDILFFDVGYTREGRVDNVNRRPSVYSLQLNILNYDTSNEPLTLNDIYVSVQGNEVVLRSRLLNKRLLPRLATAYNYHRSDLSVFRLLMDIQNQNLQTNLIFKLPGMIPGLQFYPRIQYKNIIVSPAAWRLPKAEPQVLGEKQKIASFLQKWLTERVATTHIKTGKGDQTLCLALHLQEDMQLLTSLYLKEEGLIVEEAAVPDKGIIQDKSGAAYLPQVVVALQHDQPITQPLTTVQEQFPAFATATLRPPGSDWLYFQIFCSQHRSDDVLEKISGYLEAIRSYLRKWFFIRYDEGGHHLRLRLHLNESENAYWLIARLSSVLRGDLESGIISDIRLCTYKPEVNRYLPDQIPDAEYHFYIDSEYVITTISEKLSYNLRCQLCIDLFDSVQFSGIISTEQLTHLVIKMTEAYNREHYVQQEQFKVINSRFKTFEKESKATLTINSSVLQERLKKSLVETLACYPKLIRPKILADLLHMHINRLFPTDQRAHEMLFYNYLSLILKRRKHLSSQAV